MNNLKQRIIQLIESSEMTDKEEIEKLNYFGTTKSWNPGKELFKRFYTVGKQTYQIDHKIVFRIIALESRL